MAKPIQKGAEMKELKREMLFVSAPMNETNEGTRISIRDPDTMLTMIALLLACLALAVLAAAVI
jgi:hypothetical protein